MEDEGRWTNDPSLVIRHLQLATCYFSMKYLEEYRSPEAVKHLSQRILTGASRKYRIMEVCGGQTHAIMRYGLDRLIADKVEFLHGPGCPVCVTASEIIDKAVEIAETPGVIFCTFGDMLRVPGNHSDLFSAKARGGEVRVVYSPTDAVKLAAENPERQVVFFAVGFETTAPANALSVAQAHQLGLTNFYLLSSMVLIPPAIELLLQSGGRIDAMLAPGHVCTVTGLKEYHRLSHTYKIPIAVTGFEPADILLGTLACVEMLENGSPQVENSYSRAVRDEGNIPAQELLSRIFHIVDRNWRGIGFIPQSGFDLNEEYLQFDALLQFGGLNRASESTGDCIAGLILRGEKKPDECPSYGTICTPAHPLGATMVSSEGACAAYYKYKTVTSSK